MVSISLETCLRLFWSCFWDVLVCQLSVGTIKLIFKLHTLHQYRPAHELRWGSHLRRQIRAWGAQSSPLPFPVWVCPASSAAVPHCCHTHTPLLLHPTWWQQGAPVEEEMVAAGHFDSSSKMSQASPDLHTNTLFQYLGVFELYVL